MSSTDSIDAVQSADSAASPHRAAPTRSLRRNVTMGDIAASIGVSRTAVSFALNGRADASVSAETRERVLRAAADLGYRPNAGARALASQRSNWYGIVTEIVTAPFAVDVIKGAQDVAAGLGKFLLITSSENEGATEADAVEKLLEQRVEGVVYAATWHRGLHVPAALREVPTVMVNCFDAAGELPSIVPDEEGGGYRATRRLIDAGHERIGLITLDPSIPAARGRRAGYERALAEAGIALSEELVVAGFTADDGVYGIGSNAYGTADGGYLGASQLLDLPAARRPTALFCTNDRLAMGAYDAIKERGLRIPDDVAVVGFDNQELISAYLRPRLTTVALPFNDMGRRGIEMLDAMTNGQPPATSKVVVDCPLLERSSV